MNETELLCYGEGDNVIPTIYLDDLVSIIVEVAETTPEIRYIIAVDDSKNTLFDIIKVNFKYIHYNRVSVII